MPACRWTAKPPKEAGELYGEGVKPVSYTHLDVYKRQALDKAEEELGELRQAVEQGANVEEELGDLLFAAVKVGRFAGLDSEQALHGTCEKFIRRFRRVEELAGGRPLDSLGLHRLEELWQQAKQDEA